MNFEEVIRYKALALKSTISGVGIGDLFQNTDLSELPSMKNICATIHISLFDKVESVTGLLNISKRQFVEHALIEAVEKANSIINEVNPMEFKDEFEKEFK